MNYYELMRAYTEYCKTGGSWHQQRARARMWPKRAPVIPNVDWRFGLPFIDVPTIVAFQLWS